MRRIIEIKNNQPNNLRINYEVGDICNYKCWYCYPGSNEGTMSWPNADVVKHNLVTLIKHYKDTTNVNEIKLSFLGGEATLWPELGKVIKHVVTQTNCKIYIITNGSRTIRWWKEYGQYFDNVSISIHHESVDVDHILKLVKVLEEKKITYFANVLMDHTAWDKCVDIVNKLSNKKLAVFVKPVYVNGQLFYTADQKEYLKTAIKSYPSLSFFFRHFKKLLNIINLKITSVFEDGSKIVTKNENYFSINMLNNFKGWECTLGINHLGIKRDGTISGSCGQHLFDKDYNINDVNFDFKPKIETTICTQKLCTCPGEMALPKKRLKQ
jgi:organic radical activating enzyme